MLEGIERAFGEMPEMLREGMELKINSALYMIYKFQRKTGKKLEKIGIHTENGCCLEPIYFFENTESGYTRVQLREELSAYSTTQVIGK